jgi:DnaJ-class molecular chaperone
MKRLAGWYGKSAGNAAASATALVLVHSRRTGDTVWAATLGLVGLVFAVYLGSLSFNPWVKCSRCQGKQRLRGWMFSNAYHNCPKCKGTGRQERWGHKVFINRSGQKPPM